MNGAYTEQEKEWLRNNAPLHSYRELAAMLLQFSGRKVRDETLCEYCRTKLGIGKAENFGFKPGNRPKTRHRSGQRLFKRGGSSW